MEGPVHGEEDVVVDHLGLVVQPRLRRLQAHHVHDLRDPEAPAPVRPNHLQDRKSVAVVPRRPQRQGDFNSLKRGQCNILFYIQFFENILPAAALI